MRLTRDTDNNIMQVFTPFKIIEIQANVEWEPNPNDRAFRIPSDCTYKINGSSLSAVIYGGTITGIGIDKKFTFDTSMNIEVM